MAELKTYTVSEDITSGSCELETLHSEIETSGHVTNFSGLVESEGEVIVIGDSIADEASLDTIIADHEPESLIKLKARRCREIDKNTGYLISLGFTYDSEQFSMSRLAQTNWIGLKQAAENNLLTYPFEISTLNDGQYDLSDAADVTAFYTTGLGTKIGHLASGRSLKVQVNAATTKAAVNAVVDNR